MLVIIPGAFNYLALPLFAKKHSQNNLEEIRRAYRKIGGAVFQISLPVLIIILLFAPQFLKILYGTEYLGAAGVLAILCLGTFADAVIGPASDALVASGNTRIPLYAAVAGCISNVFLNIWLIPLLGIVGAAIATCTSMYLAKSILAFFSYRQYRIIALSRQYLIYILISGSTALITRHLYHAWAFGNDMICTLGLSAFYLFSTYCMFFAWNHITSKTVAMQR
jgi:O-antigen/teichoic acid export membrane protein